QAERLPYRAGADRPGRHRDRDRAGRRDRDRQPRPRQPQVGEQGQHGRATGQVDRQQRHVVDALDHGDTTPARALTGSYAMPRTSTGSSPTARARTTSGDHATSSEPVSLPLTGTAAGPWLTRRSIRRKYAAVSAAPAAATTPRVTHSAPLRCTAATTANISPQKPARPGRPSDAIAPNPSRPARTGACSRSPPSRASSPVWLRSLIAPARKNSRPVMTPWATLPIRAAWIPTADSVAMPSSTNPMWPTDEYAMS